MSQLPPALNMPVDLTEGTDYQGSNTGLLINSIQIDNISGSWLYIPAANRYVPPWFWGVVFQATTNSRDCRALWQNPNGIVGAPGKLGVAHVVFTDQQLPPSSGFSIAQQSSVFLGVVPGASSATFLLPTGTQAVLIANNGGGTGDIVSVVSAGQLIPGGEVVSWGNGPVTGTPIIVPISAIYADSITITVTGLSTVAVLALFTPQGEPTEAVSVTGTADVNIAQLNSGPAVGQETMDGSFPVVIASDQSIIREDIALISGVPVLGAAGTLGVDIRAIGGGAGVLNVNLADLNGSASVVGQEPMAASLPVVIASDQSAVRENLTEVGGAALTLGRELMAASLPVVIASDQGVIPENLSQVGGVNIAQGQHPMVNSIPVVIASDQSAVKITPPLGQQVMAASVPVVIASDQSPIQENLSQIAAKNVAVLDSASGVISGTGRQIVSGTIQPQGGAIALGYLGVLQRPTILIAVARINVIIAGTILLAAPGVGFSIVLRRVLVTLAAAALAADVISMGSTLTGGQLAQWGMPVGAAATPDISQLPWEWEDYAFGDNLPVCISSNVATFTNTSIMIAYSIVVTNNWPAA